MGTFRIVPKTVFNSYWERIRLQFNIDSRISQIKVPWEMNNLKRCFNKKLVYLLQNHFLNTKNHERKQKILELPVKLKCPSNQ